LLGLRWLSGLARRRTGRLLGESAGIGLVVMMIASLGAFFTASRARMTEQAVAAVPVDWQVLLSDGSSTAHTIQTIRSAPGVETTLPVAYADVFGFRSSTAGTVRTTGSGKLLGLPSGFARSFSGEIRPLLGSTSGVLLAQQTAANLGASVGSRVSIRRPGLPPVSLVVEGIVDLPAADQLFQAIGVASGVAPTAPPDNVMLVPDVTWRHLFAGSPPGTTSTEIFTELSHVLPADPGAAFSQVIGRAKNLEASLAGGGLVGDNLAAQLDGARSDAIYAQLLFLFLGLPGVVIAALLAGAIATTARARRRRDQALLRVRGATPRTLVWLASVEAVTVAFAGACLGLGAAVIAGQVAFATSRFGATTAQAAAWTAIAVLSGIVIVALSMVVPAWRDARAATVREARAGDEIDDASKTPLWARLRLDLVCLASGGLIYWQAVKSGYQVVLAPEGIPTISVSYFTLLAPLLLWIGAALLSWRIGTWALGRGTRAIKDAVRPIAHGLSGVVAATMRRRRRPLARGLLLMSLTASFALSVAIFDTTYAAQARVDAQLTNGADVTATTTAASGLPAGLAGAVRTLPGVAAAEPMQHRFAYVGNDLQDLYGIDPATIAHASTMSDAFFADGSADQILSTLAATPDGVLVSEETVHDFQLHTGDMLRLRLQSAADLRYHVVPFTYVGVAREFPTAPRDSFLVANASYVAGATHSSAAQTLLVRTSGSPPTVAHEIRGVLGRASGATVTDIVSEQRITLSALTAIDLAGLTRLQLAFALVLAAAAAGLVLALGIAERRRTFAIASALGAKSRQLGAFIWSEAYFVAIGGAALGVAAGWGMALVIVKILTGVFDPPPERLAIPWIYLVELLAATAASMLVAGSGMLRATRRPAMTILRDL
jgi:putative ABC transport system permease protein